MGRPYPPPPPSSRQLRAAVRSCRQRCGWLLRSGQLGGVDDFGFAGVPGSGCLVGVEVVETPLAGDGFDGVGFDAPGQFGAVGVQDDVAHRNCGILEAGADFLPVLVGENRLRDDQRAADVVEDLGGGGDGRRVVSSFAVVVFPAPKVPFNQMIMSFRVVRADGVG